MHALPAKRRCQRRVERNRVLQAHISLAQAALRAVYPAERGVRLGQRRIDRDGALRRGNRFRVARVGAVEDVVR